jgi:flagellar assembly protein FliH
MNDSAPNISKFTFDTEFCNGGAEVMSDAARARLRKSLTQEEIDAMCAEARAAGLNDGTVRAVEKTAAAVTEMARSLRLALETSTEEIERIRAEAAHIALAAAGKMARAALERFPAEDVEATLHEAIRQALGEPRLSLRASPQAIEALRETLETIAGENGFEGRISAVADSAFEASDCRIEWRGGGAEHKLETIEADVVQVVERYFSQERKNMSTKG